MAGKLIEEQRAEMVQMYKSGESLRSLEERFRTHRRRIKRILGEPGHGLRSPSDAQAASWYKRKGIDIRAITADRWREIYWGPEKPSLALIAQRLGYSPTTVRRYLSLHGISIRSLGEQIQADLKLGRRELVVGLTGERAADHMRRICRGWHPGLLSPAARKRSAAARDKRVTVHCHWCGRAIRRSPCRLRGDRQFCDPQCCGHGVAHFRWHAEEARPLILAHLRDLLTDARYRAMPFTRETLEKAAATIGAAEPEILVVMLEGRW